MAGMNRRQFAGLVLGLPLVAGEEENFIGRYLSTASEDELKVLDELAELDRKHGNKPTPALSYTWRGC